MAKRPGAKRLTLELDGATYVSLRRLGVDLGETNQAMMERAVKEFLARHKAAAEWFTH